MDQVEPERAGNYEELTHGISSTGAKASVLCGALFMRPTILLFVFLIFSYIYFCHVGLCILYVFVGPAKSIFGKYCKYENHLPI